MFRTHQRWMALSALIGVGISAPAMAQTVADALAAASGSSVTVTDGAVVTAVLSSTATQSTYLLEDSTGAIEGFDVPNAGDNGANPAANPVVGDSVDVSGTLGFFHELPEIEKPSISQTIVSTGNPLPPDVSYTLADLQNGSTTGPGKLLEVGDLDNVTFVETGLFSTANENSNEDFEVTDGSKLIGPVFISSSSPLFGTAIPTTPVDIHGYLSIFSSTPDSGFEFDLLGSNPVTSVPEPTCLSLLALGGMGLMAHRRRV